MKELKAKNYKTLEQFAAAEKLAIDTIKFYDFSMPQMTGLGNEPALMAASVKAEPNKVVGPIKVKEQYIHVQSGIQAENSGKI